MIKIIRKNISEALSKTTDAELFAILNSSRNTCWKTGEGYGISLRFCDIRTPSEKEDIVYIVLDREHLVFLSENQRVLSCVNENRNGEDAMGLHDFFTELIDEDMDILDDLETRILSIEGELLDGQNPGKSVLIEIMELKHGVLRIKRYYEQLEMICETLSENENDVFSEKMEERFRILATKIDHLHQNALHLYECLTQVREVYQAQIDIQQNNVMKMFTVITTIFFPLTLITGWYGMNLKMPEFSWNLGYLFVIFLSLGIIVLSIGIFKKKKWF